MGPGIIICTLNDSGTGTKDWLIQISARHIWLIKKWCVKWFIAFYFIYFILLQSVNQPTDRWNKQSSINCTKNEPISQSTEEKRYWTKDFPVRSHNDLTDHSGLIILRTRTVTSFNVESQAEMTNRCIGVMHGTDGTEKIWPQTKVQPL